MNLNEVQQDNKPDLDIFFNQLRYFLGSTQPAALFLNLEKSNSNLDQQFVGQPIPRNGAIVCQLLALERAVCKTARSLLAKRISFPLAFYAPIPPTWFRTQDRYFTGMKEISRRANAGSRVTRMSQLVMEIELRTELSKRPRVP